MTLFSSDKEPVVGPGIAVHGHTLRPITVEGKTVGWLGLISLDHLRHPLNVDFLKQQTKAMYLAGLGVFILAGVVSFLLSRHLLAPIQKLAQGTKDLTSFRFDTRIDVRTRDELGQLAIDFNAMAQTLKKYEEMRQQWISDIAHELRTPLAILRGEIEAVQDGIRDIKPETLDSLHSEVTRIGKLVEDLHLLSVLDSQKLVRRRDPVKPLSILRDTVLAFRTRLEGAGIEVRANLLEDDRAVIAGDADRLAQLFSNLIENTIRYTDSPGMLRLSYDFSHGTLTLVFEDSPPGVPADCLGRLFDRLYRLDKSRSRALGGSGLGLSICKEIVERHGGTIRADHASLGGVRISTEFPLIER